MRFNLFVLLSTVALLEGWQDAQVGEVTGPGPSGAGRTVWSKPEEGRWKLSVNGAVLGGVDGGGGMICRDHLGHVKFLSSQVWQGMVDSVIVEALVLKKALERVVEENTRSGTIESDCLGVVLAINSEEVLLTPLGAIVEDCKFLLRSLNDVKVVHIRKTANRVSNKLARRALLWADWSWGVSSLPDPLPRLLALDAE